MSSHHFVGSGLVAPALGDAANDPDALRRRVTDQVSACGLEVVGEQTVRFENDGLTLVWILAESHLVLHYWGAEGYVTIDLHVCDYRDSNRVRARRLAASLGALCFAAGSGTWHEMHLADPVERSVSEAAVP